MKNIILIIAVIITLTSRVNSQSQNWQFNEVTLPPNSNFIDPGNKPFFVTADVGYILACYNNWTNINMLKTTNSGINWYFLSQLSNDFHTSKYPTMFFFNEEIGYAAICHTSGEANEVKLLKTSNSGLNWINIGSNVFNNQEGHIPRNIKINFINENIGFLLLGKGMYKTTNGGVNWNNIYSPTYGILYDFEIGDDNQTIYVGGLAGLEPILPVLAYSTNAGLNFTTIYNGTSEDKIGGIKCISMSKINNEYVVRFGLLKYSNDSPIPQIGKLLSNNSIDVIWSNAGYGNYVINDICFTKSDEGFFYLSHYSSPSYNSKYMLKSTNGGYNWTEDITFPSNYELNFFNNVNDVLFTTYLDWSIPFDENPLYICTRKVGMHLTIFDDLTRVSGNYNVNNQGVSISVPYTEYYLRGGTNTTLNSETVKNSGQQIFYKWNNASVNYYDNHYYFDTQGDIAAHFKTKLKTTASDAISNESQTKCLRDGISGRIHQIHQTMGGIFYSYTSSNGEFYTEEVVNGGSTYVSQFPDDKTAEGNKNPSICEIKWFGNGAPDDDYEYVIAGCWERYDNSSEKTKLYAALRQGCTVSETNGPKRLDYK